MCSLMHSWGDWNSPIWNGSANFVDFRMKEVVKKVENEKKKTAAGKPLRSIYVNIFNDFINWLEKIFSS